MNYGSRFYIIKCKGFLITGNARFLHKLMGKQIAEADIS